MTLRVFAALLGALCLFAHGIAHAQVESEMRPDYKAGVRAYKAGDLKKAVIFFQQGANDGDPRAEFALGTHYAFAEGVPEDLGKARVLIESSAGKQYPPALTMLAVMYQKGKGAPVDYAKAVEYLRKAALLCESQAQSLLANALYEGQGTARNRPEALAWLLFASDRGEAEARQEIPTVAVELGPVEQDEARDLYKKYKSQVTCQPMR